MMLSIVLGCIILPGVVLGFRVEPKALNVDYQIHSYNDLKELPQVLVKGARRFKFDPHYVKNSSGCGEHKSCLLLNHDNPTTDVATYNTSTELLNYLKSTEFTTITDGERVTVALCFKAAPTKCQKTAAFEDWLALVDDFYLQAQSVPKQVEFILDGDAKPVDCLVGRWEKWNSVWISSPAEPFYSNDKENDMYRFQILNNPENKQNWTWLATPDVNYGKFSNGSYPYQLWEPDSMQDIRSYIDIYHAGARHDPGYHFAINIDIAMFRVYSSRAQVQPTSGSIAKQKSGCESTLSISQPLLGPGPTDSAGDANPLLVQLGTTGLFATVTARSHKDIVISTVLADSVEYQATTIASVTLAAEDSAWLLGEDQASASLVSAVYIPGHDAQTTVVAVMNSAGRVLLLSLAATADSLQVSSVSQQSLPESLLTGTALDLVPYQSSDVCEGFCWLVVTAESVGVNLSVLQGTYHSTSGKSLFAVVQSTSLVVPSPSGIPDTARVAILDETVGAAPVLFLSQGLTVYAGEVSLAATTATPLWRAVSTGKHVQLSTVGHGADRAMMMLTDFGYCYNSHTHNTRAYPTVCASTPTPTETVLDYSLGLAAHWLEALRSSDNVVKDTTSSAVTTAGASVSYVATSCSAKILHGSYDQGSRPAIALTKQAVPGTETESYFFLEVHEGLPVSQITKLGSRGGGECGDPVHHDGIVLDAFEIDSWVRRLQRVYA